MKVRSFSPTGTRLRLAAAGLVVALALGGCGGSNSNSAGSAGGASQGAAEGGSPAGPGGGRHRMGQVLMSLGLSDDQKSRIHEIMSNARKESANADPETRRANFKAALAKIDTVLTPDQRAKLHAKLDEMRKERGQGAPSQS